MEILRLSSNDIVKYKDSVVELLKLCIQYTYETDARSLSGFLDEKYNALINYAETGKAYVFGAVDGGKLTGFLWGYPVETPFETVFHVAYISVLETGRRLGTGQKLLAEAEKQCALLGLKNVELIVGAENASALSFYDHCGYKPCRYYLKKEVE